jgi:catechol 2,3-dioxygenase-like lactoylglutathione lyase family enzyme
MKIDDASFSPNNANSVIKPYMLSHGTLECVNLARSRLFYEEFLGLECVRHGKVSMLLRCGMKWHIVAVEVRNNVHPTHLLNHWGIEVRTKEEADQAWADAMRLKDHYGIRKVHKIAMQRGVYAFYMQDLDQNWWEISYSPIFRHDEYFKAGDKFGRNEQGDDNSIAAVLKERDAADLDDNEARAV